jgi:hypothetical protein
MLKSMRVVPVVSLAALLATGLLDAQTRRTQRPAQKRPEPTREAPEIVCPAPLGVGVKTDRSFCDVLSGADPAQGVLIPLPAHDGAVTLTFDLHNRHTYSEEQVKAKRAFARYTASIGVLTMDNTLIRRAAIQSEFRTEADLIDRISGGAGPSAVKAVAPTGVEHIRVTIPAAEKQVSLLGERLTIERIEGAATYSSPGRPIAVVSNVMIEYRPPPPRPARRPARRR